MSYPSRNVVVGRLGTPNHTDGSVNNPVIHEEDDTRHNERWIYDHLIDDPSGMPQRVIYWQRYDLVATRVRANSNETWRDDRTLIDELSKADPRLSEFDPANNPPIQPSNRYRPVSDFKDKIDLGGYVQSEDELRGALRSKETPLLKHRS
jgi:hypothetical protein